MIFAQYHRMCPNVVLSVTVGVRESILDQLRMSKFDVYLGMLDGGLMSGQKAVPLYSCLLYTSTRTRFLCPAAKPKRQFRVPRGVHVTDALSYYQHLFR